MTTLQFDDTHNLFKFLTKSAESEGFEQIVDFLNATSITYALTVNPTIYTSCIEQFWSTVKAKTVNRQVQLQALVDGKKVIITEATVRRDLQLEDVNGVDCLPNATIFKQLTLIGYEKLSQKLTFYKSFFSPQWKFLIHAILQCLSAKTSAWNEFSITMAFAIICLATNQKFTFPNEVVNEENVSKHSNDLLLSGDDRLKLEELMALCTNLQNRVLDLDRTKTTQALEIDSLKRRVKKLEKKQISKTHRLKRLYKVSLSARVVSSENKGLGEEDASKQGRKIHDIDADEDITLENVHDEDMFGVNDLDGDEVVVESEVVDKDVNLSIDEVTLAHALAALKSAKVQEKGDVIKEPSVPVSVASTKVSTVIPTTAATTIIAVSSRPRAKGIVFHEQEQAPTPIVSSQQPTQVQDKGKGKMNETEPVKKLSKNDQLRLDEELAFRLQAAEEEEERLAREKAQQIKEANTTWDAIQAKVEADYHLAQRLHDEEQEQYTDEKKAKFFCKFLDQRRKFFAAKRAEDKKNKPPTQAQQRKMYSIYLKNMEGYTLKQLKGFKFEVIKDIFGRAFKRVNTFVDHEKELIEESSKKGENEKDSSSKRTGEELESDKSKKQKLDEKVEVEVDGAKEAKELKQCLEIVPDDGDDVTVDATPFFVKMPIINCKIYQERKKSFFQIIRADDNSQMYLTFTKMLKNFDREDLKTMFEHQLEDNVWKNQQGLIKVLNRKLYDSYGVHCVTMQNILYYLLVEKMYPLTKHTLHQMFNDVKLQVDYECEMAFELLRMVKKQLKEGYVPQ
ncbi:hypothetical protein Tco_0005296 [Tanacetum coccineum]